MLLFMIVNVWVTVQVDGSIRLSGQDGLSECGEVKPIFARLPCQFLLARTGQKR